MNAFPSDTIYRSQTARNQDLLAEARREQRAKVVPRWLGVMRAADWVRGLPSSGRRATALPRARTAPGHARPNG